MYKPIRAGQTGQFATTTLMSPHGEDIRDIPELLQPQYALKMTNYTILSDGKIAMRKGLSTYFTDGVIAPTMLEEFTDDLFIYGIGGTTVKAYERSTGTMTTIKTFTTPGDFISGQRYGDYFFVTNGTEAIGRVSRTLAYDGQTANFTVGKKITGATSGATAIIQQDADAGATGTLTLGSIVGTFSDNEIITDNNTAPGSATVNGALAWAYTSITNAPAASILRVIGNRLFAGRLQSDDTAVAYSDADTGTNPPFDNWTVGANANDAGLLSYRNAGRVNAIEALGQNIIVFSDQGKWSWYINVIDSAGTLKKVDVTTMNREDLGGYAAIVTPKGLFYVNKAGIWQLISVGQPDIPFSDQEDLASRLLGNTYFDDIDLDGASMTFDGSSETVYVSVKNDSAANNYIISYNTVFKAFARFTGWSINNFLNNNQTIYGTSSITGKVFQCFDGSDDDGNIIFTEYYQELKVGELEQRSELLGAYIKGFLSPSTSLTIRFDIYDVKGHLIPNKMSYLWTADGTTSTLDEYGKAIWGESSWGGDGETAGLVESFAGGSGKIKNFQRIRVNISGSHRTAHQLNWSKLIVRVKQNIRRRNLTLL